MQSGGSDCKGILSVSLTSRGGIIKKFAIYSMSVMSKLVFQNMIVQMFNSKQIVALHWISTTNNDGMSNS